MTRASHGEDESAPGDTNDACIFCEPRGRNADLILFTGRLCYVILNLYPYNNGHLMVVPNRHIRDLASTTTEERAELMALARLSEIALVEAYTPHGINAGINLGRPAGAGVLDHLHVHAVPRWNGDTNFMTVIGETRVLPEDLQASKKRLQPIFERLSKHEETKPRSHEERKP